MSKNKPPEIVRDRLLNIYVGKKEYTINFKKAEHNPCGQSLILQRWYWGDASRDLIEIAMKDKPDGTFVLRDASTEGDFTLTLKVRKQDKLIKILCKNGKCGFNYDSLEYDTVLELLDVHRECSLQEYNPDLNIPLVYPLGRVVVLGKKSNKVSLDNGYKRIYMALRCHMEGIIADYERVTILFDHLYWRKETIKEGIEDRKKKIKTFDQVSWLICERIKYMDRVKPNVAAWVKDNFMKTTNRFYRLVRQIKEVRPLLYQDSMEFADLLSVIDNALEGMESEVISAYETAEDWKQIIADHGLGIESVNGVAQDVNYLVSLEPVLMSEFLLSVDLPWDPTNWISVDSNKERAAERITTIMENMAGTDTNGIFLIRPSASRDKCFVLTISMDKKIHNCLIYYQAEPRPGEDETAGFAFMDTPNYFPTLVDFVKFYTVYSLKEHNSLLNTTLKYPAFTGDNVTNYI